MHAFFCINIIGALTREKTSQKKPCSLSLTMESYLPRQEEAQERAAHLSRRLEERIQERRQKYSFYKVILICCPQKWLNLLEAEDIGASENKELLAHRAQEMAFRSCASPLN